LVAKQRKNETTDDAIGISLVGLLARCRDKFGGQCLQVRDLGPPAKCRGFNIGFDNPRRLPRHPRSFLVAPERAGTCCDGGWISRDSDRARIDMYGMVAEKKKRATADARCVSMRSGATQDGFERGRQHCST
jgi:hypothetical protein